MFKEQFREEVLDRKNGLLNAAAILRSHGLFSVEQAVDLVFQLEEKIKEKLDQEKLDAGEETIKY